MSYVEIITMGEGAKEVEFQPWSESQKEAFIRRRITQFSGNVSEDSWKELDIRLLHPEVLTWEGSSGPSRLPPQHGRIVDISPDIGPGGRRRKKSIVVNFSSTAHITGISTAKFGLGAVEITQGGEMVLDCSRLESPHGDAQAILPNTFVDRTPTLIHK